MELINLITCRPRKIEAIFNVLKTIKECESKNFYKYFCKEEIKISEILKGSELIGLIINNKKKITLTNEYLECSSWNDARKKIALRITSARNTNDDNFRFCRFYAWLINRTDIKPTNLETLADKHNFELELHRDDSMNKEKANLALEWAVELGLGWLWKDSSSRFEAIPTEFIEWLLPEILEDNPIESSDFIRKISDIAPCIYGIVNTRGLSSGLSRSLRQLHVTKKIILIERRDTPSSTLLNNYGFKNEIGNSFCQISKNKEIV